jgi:hypothetical protein
MLWEEHRLRVFENRMLKRICGPKRDEVTGEWRKLHNGELHNLYSTPDIIKQIKSRRMRWAGLVVSITEEEKCARSWSGSPKETDHSEDRGVDGKMGLDWVLGKSAGGGGVEWIHLAQDRDQWRAVVNMVMKLRVLAPRS